LNVLSRLVDAGNTVIVIEHNLDVIKTADWIIDLGPDGGKNGGRIVAQGAPEAVSQIRESYTGQFLKHALKKADNSTPSQRGKIDGGKTHNQRTGRKNQGP
jgi:excinuclease ABC subunit A